MSKTTEETGLATLDTETGELLPTAEIAKEQTEIQSAIIIAKKMPRSEDQAFSKLMRSCQRPTFAEDVSYSFPRGEATVTGPSVHLAREAARVWGNIRYGLDILTDAEDSRVIEGWAWDMETNTKVTSADAFKKLIYRKKGGWVKPDERDLRELTNRRGAILVRNCILQLLPKDLIEDALFQAAKTVQAQASEDPDAAKKRLLASFATINVTADMLTKRLGHPLSECTPQEITELRGVYKSIADGNSKWSEYAADPKEKKEADKGNLSMEDLKAGTFEKPGATPEPNDLTAGTLEKFDKKKGRRVSATQAAYLAELAEDSGWKPLELTTLLSEYGYRACEEVRSGDVDEIKEKIKGGTE